VFSSSMLVSPSLSLVVLLVAVEADKVGLLVVDIVGELLAHHAVPPAPFAATEHQHQPFIQ
jgi:hypothetical protein